MKLKISGLILILFFLVVSGFVRVRRVHAAETTPTPTPTLDCDGDRDGSSPNGDDTCTSPTPTPTPICNVDHPCSSPTPTPTVTPTPTPICNSDHPCDSPTPTPTPFCNPDQENCVTPTPTVDPCTTDSNSPDCLTPTSTPVPPPSNPGGPGDGRSDGGSSCPSCTAPPGGNSSGGQVLGASTDTLAATGTNDQFIKIMLSATASLVIFLLGEGLMRAHENS